MANNIVHKYDEKTAVVPIKLCKMHFKSGLLLLGSINTPVKFASTDTKSAKLKQAMICRV